MTSKTSLRALAGELTEAARSGDAGRASRTLVGSQNSVLRQTVVALLADASLAEHESPGEATLYVVNGRVRLDAGEESWEMSSGELLDIPQRRHSLHALEDSVVLLSSVPREFIPAKDGTGQPV